MADIKTLEKFAQDNFGVPLDTLIAALELSPNAQGYISGAVTELELKKYLERKGYEILRIKEKWEGDKLLNHHGDFYIKKKGQQKWFVLESKGVKSNSEKWHRLFNKNNLVEFLDTNRDKTPFKSKSDIENYINNNLPLFNSKHSTTLYTLNEIRKYKSSKRETEKSNAIQALSHLKQEELEKLISDRLNYVMGHIRVIETHLVSGGSEKSERTQATPRKDEFHILSLDLFLRTGKHEFIFVNPKDLTPSSSDSNHLQQNYLVGFFIKDIQDKPLLQSPWSIDFDSVFESVKDPVNEEDMQIDHRADGL